VSGPIPVMRDLKDPRWMWMKAVLLALIATVCLGLLWLQAGGGWQPPANGARRSPGVLVLAERRAPWRPHTSRGFGLRSRRMGSTDSERCPELRWRFSPRDARP
jgi:hypothetical protein